MWVCLEKPFLSAGWIADGVWRGQQQREGAEIVVSQGSIPAPGIFLHFLAFLTVRLAKGQLQPGHLHVGLLVCDLARGRKEKPGG